MIRTEEMRKELICPNCRAYQMHDYLREHGQIIEDGNPLLMELEQYKRALELACQKYNSGHTKPYQIYPDNYLAQAKAGGDSK